MKNSEQPIIPMPYTNQDGTLQHDIFFGLTKREHFAGLAMQGLLAKHYIKDSDETPMLKEFAYYSVQFADALLAELDKPQS